jgi:WhiB family redox-sensing transcriptional regulator
VSATGPDLSAPLDACGSGRTCSPVDWRQSAACRGSDPELWFSPLPAHREQAAGICAPCPVRSDCLSEALRFEATSGGGSFGLWGGRTEQDRRRTVEGSRASARRGRSRWGAAR